MAHLRGGQVPVLFLLPSGKSLPRAGLGGFWPVRKDSCHVAAHPEVPYPVSERLSLRKCHAAVGGWSEEPECCCFPEQKQRRILLVPFVQLCADRRAPLSRRAGMETPAPRSRAGLRQLSADLILRIYSPVMENILTL